MDMQNVTMLFLPEVTYWLKNPNMATKYSVSCAAISLRNVH